MSVAPKRTAELLWLEQQRARQYEQHRKRVEQQKPCVDNKTPRNLSLSNKRALMEQERRKCIDEENRRLVVNMSAIMERGGGIDNKEPWRRTNGPRDAEIRRRREQQKLAEENLKLLHRLENVKPVYRLEKWEMERDENEILVDRISRYPYIPMNRRKGVGE
ncbi:KIAA1430 homologue, putative [Trypanosoma equiperdum]|uniref:Uncharacterized protein n=4 Tax=Trypanozoon TaxID=39700 RepID=Q38AV7_TRYB2|nr:hypothetical protein, conserved [Trypanosoma brucei gambiense DAL972]XP_822891.1 hypothetical protein, conserved [Trypanosoma brucei brucei TREU927]RHW68937.1 KIAA1430-like protein [Trypanosoma brucei equiperdum]SCU73204.1 KIAA1430 homologue, putative [Trypanosoma equiperdum]EAN78063.1 hypothetical protein, conserved [Trypanosoma brucei brucei TREU927]CBH15705.1 hypothetical protein, conserved [Trypanosoma brucei gambiense DAL972]|eukprot:XP_011777969.1 hypothetical protein, conserved [Trypanosoma brucei gambiense DAL972]